MKTHNAAPRGADTKTVNLRGGEYDGDKAKVPTNAPRLFIPIQGKPSVKASEARPRVECYIPTPEEGTWQVM